MLLTTDNQNNCKLNHLRILQKLKEKIHSFEDYETIIALHVDCDSRQK